MSSKKIPPFKAKPKFAIVVDGDTEFWYFQMLKRNERNIGVDIKPELPQRKKLAELYSQVVSLSGIYDKVYWIVDMDVILSESLSAPKGQKKAIDFFLEYQRVIAEKYKSITVIVNQPCLEFWFLVHFENTAKPFANCKDAEKMLKKHIDGKNDEYEKSQKYFTRQNHDIYLRLKPKLLTAIANSKKFGAFDPNNPYKGLTEMYKLFDDIGLVF